MDRSWDDTSLLRQAREQILNVCQRGLHLDDEQDPLPRVPCEHVDRSTISIHVERELRKDFPLQITQRTDDVLHDRRVGLVEEPIALPATPLRRQREPNL